MPDALIVFSHGARDDEWRRPVDWLVRRLQQRLPELQVRAAFLELMTPGLDEAIAAALAQGAQRIVVAPVFWARGGHLKRDVPELLAGLRERHPGLVLELWPPLGERLAVLEAIADDYQELWKSPNGAG